MGAFRRAALLRPSSLGQDILRKSRHLNSASKIHSVIRVFVRHSHKDRHHLFSNDKRSGGPAMSYFLQNDRTEKNSAKRTPLKDSLILGSFQDPPCAFRLYGNRTQLPRDFSVSFESGLQTEESTTAASLPHDCQTIDSYGLPSPIPPPKHS